MVLEPDREAANGWLSEGPLWAQTYPGYTTFAVARAASALRRDQYEE